MSDGRGNDPGEDLIDVLLSAGLDGALSEEERVELDGLLEQNGAASRVEAFEEVDAALRSLAEEQADDSADEARIAASLETLRERLGWVEELPEALSSPNAPRSAKKSWLRPAPSLGFGLAAAAAAAAMLFFVGGLRNEIGGPDESIEVRSEQAGSLAEQKAEAGSEEEARVFALGYGEWGGDLSELGLASPEDLEIVEQLELLDFLAEREAEGRG